jgi:hypothetical protein
VLQASPSQSLRALECSAPDSAPTCRHKRPAAPGPYVYQWDHGLPAGAGPEHVCPSETTTYTVVATDSSGHGSGELSTPPAQGSASVTVTVSSACSDGGARVVDEGGIDAALGAEADGDAGVVADGDAPAIACADPGPAPWSGCETILNPIQGKEAFQFCGGRLPEYYACLPQPILAGQSYEIRVTFSNPFVFGAPPQFAVWGSTATPNCAESQQLTQQPLSNVSFCVTPDAHYPELLFEWLGNNSLTTYGDLTIQVCSGCNG